MVKISEQSRRPSNVGLLRVFFNRVWANRVDLENPTGKHDKHFA